MLFLILIVWWALFTRPCALFWYIYCRYFLFQYFTLSVITTFFLFQLRHFPQTQPDIFQNKSLVLKNGEILSTEMLTDFYFEIKTGSFELNIHVYIFLMSVTYFIDVVCVVLVAVTRNKLQGGSPPLSLSHTDLFWNVGPSDLMWNGSL